MYFIFFSFSFNNNKQCTIFFFFSFSSPPYPCVLFYFIKNLFTMKEYKGNFNISLTNDSFLLMLIHIHMYFEKVLLKKKNINNS